MERENAYDGPRLSDLELPPFGETVRKVMGIAAKEVCPDCEGSGRMVCLDCEGEGGGESDRWNPWTENHYTETTTCSTCEGKGGEECRLCDGAGEIER